MFKYNNDDFIDYVEDLNINDESSLCNKLLSALRNIANHGSINANGTDTPLWDIAKLYHRQKYGMDNTIYIDELKPRYSTTSSLHPVPSSPDYIFNCILAMKLPSDEERERAWLYLLLERNLLADVFERIMTKNVIDSLYNRWALFRCNDHSQMFVHYLKNLTQVDFRCFSTEYAVVGNLVHFTARFFLLS